MINFEHETTATNTGTLYVCMNCGAITDAGPPRFCSGWCREVYLQRASRHDSPLLGSDNVLYGVAADANLRLLSPPDSIVSPRGAVLSFPAEKRHEIPGH